MSNSTFRCYLCSRKEDVIHSNVIGGVLVCSNCAEGEYEEHQNHTQHYSECLLCMENDLELDFDE